MASKPSKGKARILVVDDEAAQLKALCNTLQDHGYEVVGCDNGKAGLEALHNSQFDLLLADLMMPGMDGIALLRQAFEVRGDLVGIIMTGEGTISTAVQALQGGALDYLLKPFKVSVLLPVISRALTVRQLRIEKEDLEHRLRGRTAELEASNKKLEAANDELKAYSYSIAHDLNAPLRAMDGYAKILQSDFKAQLPEEAFLCVQKISESAKRMHTLVDSLLKFSALAWLPVTKTSVKPEVIVKQVLEELQPILVGRAVQFEIGELPACNADRALLRQVFTNLISNSVKYSRARSPAIIKVGWRRNENQDVYFVQDNGAGFDMDYAKDLFRIFKRLHSDDQFEGTGVGLAIVQRIVQRHGGRIWAEGKVEGGATFQFSLGKTDEECPIEIP